MNEKEAIDYLRDLIKVAEEAIAQGRARVTISAVPSTMRALKMRGKLLSKYPGGRKIYSLNAKRLIKNCERLISEIGSMT